MKADFGLLTPPHLNHKRHCSIANRGPACNHRQARRTQVINASIHQEEAAKAESSTATPNPSDNSKATEQEADGLTEDTTETQKFNNNAVVIRQEESEIESKHKLKAIAPGNTRKKMKQQP